MTKCFCVGSILHFITATALLVCVIVNVCQVNTNKRKCREKYEFIDDVSSVSRMYPEMMNAKTFGLDSSKMEEMDGQDAINNKMPRFRLRQRFQRHHSEHEMEERCAIAHYDHFHYVYHVVQWTVIGFNIFMTYIIGILGSGIYCSSVGHRKLGLKIASIVLFMKQLFVLIGSAIFTLKFTSDFMDGNRIIGFHNSYFKGRVAMGFIMFALLAVSWIINLVHSFAACCCTPTEDEETIKIVKVNKNVNEDRLKLVDNVVFGERVFDNDGEIA